MKFKNEANILKIIKYTPPIFIISLAIIISIFLYLDTNKQFEKQKNDIEKEYLETHKEYIKEQVYRAYTYITEIQKTTIDTLKVDVKNRVYEAHTIATKIYNENKDKGEKVVKKMIQDALVDIRYNNGRGYFYIFSLNHDLIMHPLERHLEGTSYYNFQDINGKYLVRDFVNQINSINEGYMKWLYIKPSDVKNQYQKMGFNKLFEPYGWFIGTGEYVLDVESEIKQEALDHVSKLRYGNNGYMFVFDYKGTYLSHIIKDNIGKNIFEVDNIIDSKKVFQDFLELSKNAEGYTTYIQRKTPGGELKGNKTTFIKGIKNWEWIIGTGIYDDAIQRVIEKRKIALDEDFTKKLNKLMIITIFLTLVLLIVSIYISRILDEMFKNYNKEISEHLKENTKQQSILAQNAKMAAMGEMIGNIAHQWRQPLSAISSAASGLKLQKEVGNLSDEDFERALTYINDSSQYLSKTIDDFRNFFKQDKVKKEFSILEVSENAYKLVHEQFTNSEIRIISEIDDTKLYGLRNEFIQVLINILNNAKDALLKSDNERFIFLNAYSDDNNLYIKIKDNAGGIDSNVITRIFEPYFTTKHQSQGTGIGLYMVEEIITKHMDGSISVENEEFEYESKAYQGACFTISIPLNK